MAHWKIKGSKWLSERVSPACLVFLSSKWKELKVQGPRVKECFRHHLANWGKSALQWVPWPGFLSNRTRYPSRQLSGDLGLHGCWEEGSFTRHWITNLYLLGWIRDFPCTDFSQTYGLVSSNSLKYTRFTKCYRKLNLDPEDAHQSSVKSILKSRQVLLRIFF